MNSKRPIQSFLAFIGIGLLVSVAPLAPASAQLSENKNSWGTKATFSYQIQSTIGVSTSINTNANVEAVTDAKINLQPGSMITNKFGDDKGKASAVFSVSPTGSNVDFTGITGENKLMFDSGTTFGASLKTVANPDPTMPSVGSASATGIHSSTITVEKGESSYQNTYQNVF